MGGTGVAKSLDLLTNPQAPLSNTLDIARVGVQVLSDTAALAREAEAPSSMPARNEMPLVLSVNPPWKLKGCNECRTPRD